MDATPVPIAVVGIGCRLPGGANTPELLWRMLSEGRDAWKDIPEDRFKWKSFYHPDAESQGTYNHRGGHLLDQDVAAFDGAFFDIPAFESEAIDPQHRIQLEVAYEALENAGIPIDRVRGSDTAVYVAVFSQDYAQMQFKDMDDLPKYHMTGTGNAIASNRISYLFDLKGPSVTLDTGCSGGLVSIHQACQSLWLGDCSMALAGGVNLILSPDLMIPMSLMHILNKDGRCYSFDTRGAGYGRGEGAAMVVLKRLDDAIRDGDHIRAVIRNSGVNHDGKTTGITLPNRDSQRSLIRSVYQRAGLDPKDTAYIEAHGTGTAVGDVEEITAIRSVFENDRPGHENDPLYVGTIKPNIGHLESASGLAGFIKAVLMLEKGMIPPNLNLETLKSTLDFDGSRVAIPSRLEQWPKEVLRRISVNSFGYGGTNGHTIVESFSDDNRSANGNGLSNRTNGYSLHVDGNISGGVNGHRTSCNGTFSNGDSLNGISINGTSINGTSVNGTSVNGTSVDGTSVNGAPVNGTLVNGTSANSSSANGASVNGTAINGAVIDSKSVNGAAVNRNCSNALSPPQVFTLTAKNEKSLRGMVKALRNWATARLDTASNAENDEAIFNLAHTLGARRSTLQWRHSFTACSLGEVLTSLPEHDNFKPVKSSNNNRTVFVFTGQGAQWFAMGRELMNTRSPYRDSMLKSDAMLARLGASWSLIDELSKDAESSRINEACIAQPATTAIQVALVDLLYSVDVEPHAVIGHSSGEIGAAYATGALDQFSALKVAYHRGLLQIDRSVTGNGAMLAVGLGEKEASKYLSQVKAGKAVVACANSPSSSTISGDEAAIVELKTMLDKESIFARRLQVDTAYHSHHVQSVAHQYLDALHDLEFGVPRPSVKFFSSVSAKRMMKGFGAEYWVQNLVSKVRFREAVDCVCSDLNSSSQSTLISLSPLFVEIGPHSALSGPIRQIMMKSPLSSGYSSFAALSRNHNALSTFLDLSGKLFERGCRVALPSVNLLVKPTQARKVLHDLPPYAWDHSNKYWHESRLSKQHRFRPHPHHDLLGLRVVTSTSLQPVWRHVLSVNSLPWLREHTIDGLIIFPATGYTCMAIEAMRQTILERPDNPTISKYTLKDVSFISALVIAESPKQPTEVQISLSPTSNVHDKGAPEWREFRIISVPADGGNAVEHCRGFVTAELSGSTTSEPEGVREEGYVNAGRMEWLNRLRGTCSEEVDCANLYETLRSNGNYYGPNFARVKELKFDDDVSSLGTIIIPDIAECMPAQFIQPHVVHPSTLDSLLHAPIPLYGRKKAGQSVMAVGIGELNISAHISNVPNTALTAATTLSRVGSRSAAADISVFQQFGDGEQECVISITEAELFATGRTKNDETDGARDMNYQMQWDVDVDYIKSDSFKLNSAEEEIAQEQKLHRINQAAALYIRSCLEKLPGRDASSFPGHYQYFFRWMDRFKDSEECRMLDANVTTESEKESVYELARKQGVEGQMLCRVGEKLPEILTEQIEPLALMIEDDLLYRLYADDASTRCYAHMIRYMRHATFKNPNMTILELGAGTGGATVPLLEALGSNGVLPIKRYDFTDVSSGFFERSAGRLQEWSSYLEFKRLDVQGDPLTQGFSEGSYDLIIASNVLHVANYIDTALSRVRNLLKPGGRLLMIETTRVIPFYNTCIGVLPGWWGGVDDGRTNAPLLTIDQWDAALKRTGFNGIEVAGKDFEGDAQRSAMLVSKAVASEESATGLKQLSNTIPAKLLVSPSWANRGPPELVMNLNNALCDIGIEVSTEYLADENIDISGNALQIVLDDGTYPILMTESTHLFDHVKKVLVDATRVLWVTVQSDASAAVNPEKGMINGVARVARGENQLLRLITMDVEGTAAENGALDIVQRIKDVAMAEFYVADDARSEELEYVYKDGQLCIPRLVPDAKLNKRVRQSGGELALEMQPFHQPGRHLKLQVHNSGFLESIQFVDDDLPKKALADCEVEVQVEACGVNFKDVIIALGQNKKPLPMAGEYAGTVVTVPPALQDTFKVGDRVCGYGATGYASHVKVNAQTCGRIPASMSLVTAASVAVAFSTSHFALIDIADLQKGQTVLIHAAAGAVGQAALRIAQHVGAEIFATVGSESKRNLLINEFGISDNHIFSTNTSLFRKGICRLTNGKGVDVILNSLSGQLLQDSWASIASFGTFLELGKTDSHSKSALSMAPFDRQVTFASVDLGLMCQTRPERVGILLSDVLSKFESGEYSPLSPVTVMPITEIEHAFRQIQARRHVGKIVLEANSATMVKAPSKPSSGGELQLKENGTYMIAGGLGGLGLEVARFLVEHGAKYIILLSRRGLDAEKRQELQDRFARSGAHIEVFACDITDPQMVHGMIASCSDTMPPVKGVIQATMVLQDRVLAQMTLEEFHGAIRPKVTGTQNLFKALGQQLDFFLMLSSGASIIGNLSQANYAAGNAYMDALANSSTINGGSPFIALNLGPITDSGAMATSDRLKQILMRQGYILVKTKELLAMMEYSMGKESMSGRCRQFIIGFDYSSLRVSDNKYSLENPMFSHLLQSKDSHEMKQEDDSASHSIEDALASAETTEQVGTIVAEAIARKISTLVAVAFEEIDLQRSVIEFGLDSLVVIELKNWISQKFQASLQASEISEAPHIIALAMTVASRSALVPNSLGSDGKGESDGVINGQEPKRIDDEKKKVNGNGVKITPAQSITQPKQPLPDLDHTLNQYLEVIRPIFAPKEYAKMVTHVEEFRQPGGAGRILQDRLEKLANDPQVDNWQADLYARGAYLKNRAALVPRWNFFVTHFMSAFPHSAAQRAAIISNAAFQFKQQLEADELGHEMVNEQPVGMEFYSWFFNATREPRRDEDRMMQYPGNDYLVAFRRGHVYKVLLRRSGVPVSYGTLKNSFQAILDEEQQTASWVGVLTADERDSWSEVRQMLGDVSAGNKALLHVVEAASFVIYLDDAHPQNAAERGQQFLHGNGFNRWCDKTVQFAVCDNGVSATIGEHAMLDGVVIRRLNDTVMKAILEHPQDEVETNGFSESLKAERQTFQTTPILEEHIQRVRTQLQKDVSHYELVAFDMTNVGNNTFRSQKCHAKSGLQMAIQLAVRRHFGYNPVSFEPVSLSHFLKGRVELNHVLLPDVAEFCAAAFTAGVKDGTISKSPELRRLFFEAVKAHANSVMRATRGYGIDRHLLCLQWSIQNGEEVPALFSSPLYEKAQPNLVTTDCLALGALECGAFRPNPESLWIHFEPEDDRVRFSIWGPTGQTARFRELVEKSIEDVAAILEG